MGKKGPLWWRESDWLLRGSSAANQILLRHSGPILSGVHAWGRHVWDTHTPLWTEFLTHAYENITFPQLLLRAVKNGYHLCKYTFLLTTFYPCADYRTSHL